MKHLQTAFFVSVIKQNKNGFLWIYFPIMCVSASEKLLTDIHWYILTAFRLPQICCRKLEGEIIMYKRYINRMTDGLNN